MRIRRNCYLPPLSSLHQNDTDALTTNHFPPSLLRSPEKPTVMVSRINGHIISSKGDSANETKIDSMETASGVTEGMNFTTTQSNQSWCEEEKVIPLKKRRMCFERNLISEKEKEINKSDASKEELRCRRSDGKKWRCTSRRVEGYSMCAHHLEMEKLSRTRGYRRRHRRRHSARPNQKTKITEDERKDGKTKKKIMKQVKARSINSLVRNTVPLMLPITL